MSVSMHTAPLGPSPGMIDVVKDLLEQSHGGSLWTNHLLRFEMWDMFPFTFSPHELVFPSSSQVLSDLTEVIWESP